MLGAQGSGKGTQADMLAQKLSLPVISLGRIYRAETEKKTVLGEKVAAYVNQGKLVPDDMTIFFMKERLSKSDCAKGFILDGYPRTLGQAESLEDISQITHAIFINISDKEAVYRISGRTMCKCGATYHYKFKPPKKEGICDVCGEKLFIRKDDKEEMALRKRFSIFHEEINPILDFYQTRNVLYRVDGDKSIEDVHQEIIKIFSAA